LNEKSVLDESQNLEITSPKDKKKEKKEKKKKKDKKKDKSDTEADVRMAVENEPQVRYFAKLLIN
jgi:hypothetical protein